MTRKISYLNSFPHRKAIVLHFSCSVLNFLIKKEKDSNCKFPQSNLSPLKYELILWRRLLSNGIVQGNGNVSPNLDVFMMCSKLG